MAVSEIRATGSIEWNVEQIMTIAQEFESRTLPPAFVGAIEGYCNNLLKIAARVQRLEVVQHE